MINYKDIKWPALKANEYVTAILKNGEVVNGTRWSQEEIDRYNQAVEDCKRAVENAREGKK